MKLRSHVIASIIFSSLFFLVFKSWPIAVSSLFSGVLIDCDHVLDYFWEYRKRVRAKEFFDVCNNGKNSFFCSIFHSWELLALLSIFLPSMNWNPWIVGITIGFTQHIVLDQIFNRELTMLTYFVLWRLKNGFSVKKMFPNL